MSGKKHVLLIAEKGLNKSGVPSLIMSLVRSLSNKYVFDIVVFNDDNFYSSEFLSYGGNIYRIYIKPGNNKVSKLIYYFTYGATIKKQFKSILNNKRYDVIHSFKEDQSFPFLKLAKKNGISIRIVHTNTFQVIKSFKNLIYRKILKLYTKTTIKYSTSIIGPSKKVCESFFYKPIEYNVIINPCPNIIQYNNIVSRKDNQITILQVATFSDRKNQIFAIRITSELLKRGYNVNLILLGSETEIGYYNKIKLEISQLELDNHISIMGPEANQDNIYSFAHLTLLPSKEEAFGIVAVESQMRGVHCFASIYVPQETNAGNISYLELDLDKWVSAISNYIDQGIFRKQINPEPFSEIEFANKIDGLYKNV